MKILLFILLCMALASCSGIEKKPSIVYFNDTDLTISDVNKNKQPIVYVCNADKTTCVETNYPLVCMSQGKYRRITTVNPL